MTWKALFKKLARDGASLGIYIVTTMTRGAVYEICSNEIILKKK
ncbi:hypothetical protein [Lachnobacterium bovis]|nr:hypothetical protein [Lachnobacterium bovis]